MVMAGLLPAITASNTLLIEIEATTRAGRHKKSPGEPGLEAVFCLLTHLRQCDLQVIDGQ
jgi:hypothetical protein